MKLSKQQKEDILSPITAPKETFTSSPVMVALVKKAKLKRHVATSFVLPPKSWGWKKLLNKEKSLGNTMIMVTTIENYQRPKRKRRARL